MLFTSKTRIMKSSLKIVLFLTLTLIICLFSGCSGCQQEKKKKQIGEQINFDDLNVLDSVETVIMALPSPEEILSYINSKQVEFDEDILLNSEYAMQFSTRKHKTLVLGMYLADLAYISSFSRTEYFSEYTKAIDYLIKDLEINLNLSEDLKNKLLNSSFDPDEVYNISQQLYSTIINYLQDLDDGKTLTLISVGTFCETLYVSTNLHNDFKIHEPSINRIGEQKLLYEDLLTMTASFKNSGLNDIHDYLKGIEKKFNAINLESAQTLDVSTTENGVLYIKGDSKIDISKEKYFEFSQSINELRNLLLSE